MRPPSDTHVTDGLALVGTHVTDGLALVGTRDGGLVRARAGDTVVCPPGEEHWHSAAANTFAAHLAIQESAADGSGPVTWLESVSQEIYDQAQRKA